MYSKNICGLTFAVLSVIIRTDLMWCEACNTNLWHQLPAIFLGAICVLQSEAGVYNDFYSFFYTNTDLVSPPSPFALPAELWVALQCCGRRLAWQWSATAAGSAWPAPVASRAPRAPAPVGAPGCGAAVCGTPCLNHGNQSVDWKTHTTGRTCYLSARMITLTGVYLKMSYLQYMRMYLLPWYIIWVLINSFCLLIKTLWHCWHAKNVKGTLSH